MGEPEENVFTVGLPSVDLINTGEFSDENELVDKYKLQNINNIIVFTQHPIPIEKDNIVFFNACMYTFVLAIWH